MELNVLFKGSVTGATAIYLRILRLACRFLEPILRRPLRGLFLCAQAILFPFINTLKNWSGWQDLNLRSDASKAPGMGRTILHPD